MKEYEIHTNYKNPYDERYVWRTTACSVAKAMANIRWRIHATYGLPLCAIITTYWKAV